MDKPSSRNWNICLALKSFHILIFPRHIVVFGNFFTGRVWCLRCDNTKNRQRHPPGWCRWHKDSIWNVPNINKKSEPIPHREEVRISYVWWAMDLKIRKIASGYSLAVLAIETLPSISPSTNTTSWRRKNGCIRKEKQKKATAEPPFMVWSIMALATQGIQIDFSRLVL